MYGILLKMPISQPKTSFILSVNQIQQIFLITKKTLQNQNQRQNARPRNPGLLTEYNMCFSYLPSCTFIFCTRLRVRANQYRRRRKRTFTRTFTGTYPTCKERHVRVVFVQKEFDSRNAEIIAREAGVKIVSINPLSYKWSEEMIAVAKALSE